LEKTKEKDAVQPASFVMFLKVRGLPDNGDASQPFLIKESITSGIEKVVCRPERNGLADDIFERIVGIVVRRLLDDGNPDLTGINIHDGLDDLDPSGDDPGFQKIREADAKEVFFDGLGIRIAGRDDGFQHWNTQFPSVESAEKYLVSPFEDYNYKQGAKMHKGFGSSMFRLGEMLLEKYKD
jgi:hypothetical protein